jgi:site-specific DNA-methyltransferase (adenine-specific)
VCALVVDDRAAVCLRGVPMIESLLLGDCRAVLPTLPEASLEACVTDPPYELGFMGKAWDSSGVATDPATWRAVHRVLKPGAYLLACGGTRTYHRMAVAIEDAGFEIRDCLAWLYASGFPKSLNLGEGLGTALKPAYEPIIMARKRFTGTVAANVAAHGTGALNIDACRIRMSADDAETIRTMSGWGKAGSMYIGHVLDVDGSLNRVTDAAAHDLGRWPANVTLDDGAARVLDEQSGLSTSSATPAGTWRAGMGYHGGVGRVLTTDTPDDTGGASRFFFTAKPSREERDWGCEAFEAKTAAELTNRAPGSKGLQNPRAGIRAGSMDRDVAARVARNHHTTVKPVALMRWLVRLVTPIGGTVLDPFLGSGTTGMACRAEQRGYVGIEQDAAYLALAQARIAAVAPLFAEVQAEAPTPDAQLSLLGLCEGA